MTDNSYLWYGTTGHPTARIVLVGESWGAREDEKKLPFQGASGLELDKLLGEANLSRNSCFVTNVISERPDRNDMKHFFYSTAEAKKERMIPTRGLYPHQRVLDSIDRLHKQIMHINPEIVVGFGNYANWALTESAFSIANEKGKKVPTGITSWRGSQLYTLTGHKYMPTYHPAAIMRQWPWRYDLLHDLKSRLPKAFRNVWDPPKYRFHIRPSFEQVMSVLDEIDAMLNQGSLIPISVDIESMKNHHLACVGLGWSRLDAICIPFLTKSYENYWSIEEEILIILRLREIFQHPNIYIIGQNFLYDAQYFALYWGVRTIAKFDTMIAQHTCWPGKPKGLSYISSIYNNHHVHWKDEGKDYHPRFSDEQHWVYNCKDCVITYEAHEHLDSVIRKLNLREQFNTQMEQFEMLLEMMMRGVLTSDENTAQFKKELSEEIAITEKKLNDLMWRVIPERPAKSKASKWHSSPKQQQVIFYDILGLKEVRNPKTRELTVDDEALDDIKSEEPLMVPVCDALAHLRSLRIFYKTFVLAKRDIDKRIRCTYDPTGAITYRYASRKSAFGTGTNLQNIPAGEAD